MSHYNNYIHRLKFCLFFFSVLYHLSFTELALLCIVTERYAGKKISRFLLRRPYVKCSWCFFFLFSFFRPPFSELPLPIALKLCLLIEICVYFIMQVQNLGALSPKNSGAKNMQNFGRFWTTSDFDREYLRNRRNISKIGKRYKLWQFLLRLMKKVRWTLVH